MLGGFAVLWRPGLAVLQLPATAWAGWVAIRDRPCPLTALENRLRVRGGMRPYSESFIDRHLLIGPFSGWAARPRRLGVGVLLINGGIYGWLAASGLG